MNVKKKIYFFEVNFTIILLSELFPTLTSVKIFSLYEIYDAFKSIFSAVENSKGFKKQFGKNVKFWRALTDAEQRIVRLNYTIDNYATCHEDDKKQFGIKSYDNEGEEIKHYVPTLEELKAFKETLT